MSENERALIVAWAARIASGVTLPPQMQVALTAEDAAGLRRYWIAAQAPIPQAPDRADRTGVGAACRRAGDDAKYMVAGSGVLPATIVVGDLVERFRADRTLGVSALQIWRVAEILDTEVEMVPDTDNDCTRRPGHVLIVVPAD